MSRPFPRPRSAFNRHDFICISRILLYSAHEPDKTGQVGSLSLPASVVQLRYHWDQMFVALANGTVAVFKRSNSEGAWELNAPATLISLGDEPVVSLLPIGSALYAACGRSIFVLDGTTGETLVNYFFWDWTFFSDDRINVNPLKMFFFL